MESVSLKVCHVCAGEVAAHMEAWCNWCGNLYHLNSRADLPGDDCGQVWINEEHLSLEFACNVCLAPPAEPGTLDDVLDLLEAAAAAGMTPAALEALAEAGQVRHRRTAGGVLLFRRGDLPGGVARRG
ncbi:hypothetical protein [Tepidiforma sp.]|uniref:hypothetical protein n=1 Tax=Tepidiforma sp. TaxID=2682230 RepID=UPI002ADE4282|nr:hypothetical protein [Tepidiforma sp.]